MYRRRFGDDNWKKIALKNINQKRIGLVLLWGLIMILWQCQTTTIIPDDANNTNATNTASKTLPPPAVILMIGDGMGLTQLSAAMFSSNTPLAIESFPVIGFHKPYSTSDLITDSAAGATAFACGVKTYNGAIGIDQDSIPRPTLLEEAEEKGLATGLIATSTLVHATPAAFAAHQRMRVFYEDIALDMLGQDIDLLVGGGKRYFDRRKRDDRDLLAEMQRKGYLVKDYFSGRLSDVRPDTARNFAFFTADNQPLPVNQGRNYLTYAARMGCQFLQKRSDKGFFLMIEGSQIDWANHANEGRLSIQETLDFDRAIAEALSFAKKRGNTLVIVTADHESGGMAIQPKSKQGRIKTAFTTNGHTGAMVPVYAFGPGADVFSGIYENTDIYHKIRQFYNWELSGQTATNQNNY